MLHFFRRYQRFFFLIITIAIVVSFTFFGVLPKGGDYGEKKEALKEMQFPNPKISSKGFHALYSVIATQDGNDVLVGDILGPHVFPNSFLSEYILSSSIGKKILDTYGESCLSFFKDQFAHEKKYALYRHPHYSPLNAAVIWETFSPDLSQAYKNFVEPNHETLSDLFTAKANLFLQEASLPSYAQWQVVKLKENELPSLPKDNGLLPHKLNLFGYHSLEEWFGPEFLELAVQFVWETAEEAAQHGYTLSPLEVEYAVTSSEKQAFERVRQLLGDVFPNYQAMHAEKLRRMGISEKEFVDATKRVLLFEKFMQENSASLLLDPAFVQPYLDYASQTVDMKLYSLPKSLNFNTMQQVEQFQLYLNATCAIPLDSMDIPINTLSVAEINAHYPELIYQKSRISCREVSLSEVALNVSLRAIWDYENARENRGVLLKRFPQLAFKFNDETTELLSVIDEEPEALRLEIDRFVRSEIIKAHPEWISAALDDATETSSEVILVKKGGILPFKGMKPRDKAFLAEKLSKEGLSEFTFDNEHFYRIEVASPLSKEALLSFEEAKIHGVFDGLLEKALYAYYKEQLETNRMEMFDEHGLPIPFEKSKDICKEQVFMSLHHNMAIIAKNKAKIGYSKPVLRFYTFFEKQLQDTSLDTGFTFLGGQYTIQPEDIHVTRYAPGEEIDPFQSPIGKLSPIYIKDDSLYAFTVTNHGTQACDMTPVISQARKALTHKFCEQKIDTIFHRMPLLMEDENK